MPISLEEFQRGYTNEKQGTPMGLWIREYLSRQPEQAFTHNDLFKACPLIPQLKMMIDREIPDREIADALKAFILRGLVEVKSIERGDGRTDLYYHWTGGSRDAD